DERSTWASTLQGGSAAYVCFCPDRAGPGAADTIGALAELAVAHGVGRLVLLSGRGEEEAQRAERAVQEAGAEWTVVRCSWFSQNFSEGYLLEPVLAGEVALPVDRMPGPFVDADDIAGVPGAALTQGGHAGRVYELTGPRLRPFGAPAQAVAAAPGRP